MTSTKIVVMQRFTFSAAAFENIEETGIDPNSDLDALLRGEHTEESLLARCLDGADEDRVEGWRDYVRSIVRVAKP